MESMAAGGYVFASGEVVSFKVLPMSESGGVKLLDALAELVELSHAERESRLRELPLSDAQRRQLAEWVRRIDETCSSLHPAFATDASGSTDNPSGAPPVNATLAED